MIQDGSVHTEPIQGSSNQHDQHRYYHGEREYTSFNDVPNVSRDVLRGLAGMGFDKPSPVQAASIPALLSGMDVIAEAPAGSGKTAAYACPTLSLVDTDLNETQVLILVPTRALGEQVGQNVLEMGRHMNKLRVCTLLSGSWCDLSRAPHVCVAVCPARNGTCDAAPDKLLDLLERRKVSLDRLRLLVLDEADELLDRQTTADGLKRVIGDFLPEDAQVAFFSATLTDHALETARKITRGDESTILVRSEDLGAGRSSVRPALEHRYVGIGPRCDNVWEARADACEDLCDIFAAAQNCIFVRTRKQLDFVANRFHADAPGSAYTTELARFKTGQARVLLATDACGRGIDIQSVAVVINFELPTQLENGKTCAAPERYVQRAGRAGRFGRRGLIVTLVDDIEEGVAAGHTSTPLLQWLRRRTGLDIPPLSNDLEAMPGFGAAAKQEKRELPVVREEAPRNVPPPPPVVTRSSTRTDNLTWADEDEKQKLSELLAEARERAAVAEMEAQEARVSNEALRAKLQHSEEELKAKDARIGELEAEVELLSEQLEIELNLRAEEEAEAAATGSGEEEAEPILVGKIWCGCSQCTFEEDEEKVSEVVGGEHDLVGSPPLRSPSTPLSRLSADSAEWIPVKHSSSRSHSSNSSSISTRTSEKTPGCVAAAAMNSIASRSKMRFGKGTILASKLVRGERFLGKVVKILRGSGGSRCSGAFLTIGDEQGVCEKDGLVRNIPDFIEVGLFLDVVVKELKYNPNNGGVQVELALV